MPDLRRDGAPISLPDALMSGVALFALKDPSLLAFDQRRQDENMKRLFHIERVPSDTQMRTILDPVDPLELRPAFRDVFRQVARRMGSKTRNIKKRRRIGPKMKTEQTRRRLTANDHGKSPLSLRRCSVRVGAKSYCRK
ncbi:MAG TPA: hypothetical protein VF278_13940 [Pirellulales bacterium]